MNDMPETFAWNERYEKDGSHYGCLFGLYEVYKIGLDLYYRVVPPPELGGARAALLCRVPFEWLMGLKMNERCHS
jgi:hypothetical protein